MKYLEPGPQSSAPLICEWFEQRSAFEVIRKQLPVFRSSH